MSSFIIGWSFAYAGGLLAICALASIPSRRKSKGHTVADF